MDLEAIAPLLEEHIKSALEENRYKFGFANYKGTSNKIATKKLYDSVQVKAINSPQNELQILMEEYWYYVQNGRNPQGVPTSKKRIKKKESNGNKEDNEDGSPFIKSLIEWIKARKIKGRNKNGRYISNKSLAFAMRHNINKFGIRASNFMDIALEQFLEDPKVIELMEGAAVDELMNIINGI